MGRRYGWGGRGGRGGQLEFSPVASPVGHAAFGVATASVVARATHMPNSVALWLGVLIACGIPDVDVGAQLLGLTGRRGHRNATHSLVFAAGVIGLGIGVVRWLGLELPPGLLVVWIAALLSHLLLDVITTGSKLGDLGWGIPLFWPFSKKRFYLNRPLLISDRGESHTVADVLREAREDAVRIVPVCAAVVLIAELWR